MEIITKKNYIPVVCVIYTAIVLYKAILEKWIVPMTDTNYAGNLIQAFVLTLLLVAALGCYRFMQNLPLWLVILLQYGFLIVVIVVWTWACGRFTELAVTAYRDEIRSCTVVFIPIVVIYYWKCFREVRRANEILAQMNREENSVVDNK